MPTSSSLDQGPVILLAELTRLDGDVERARDLMRSTSSGRSPVSVLTGHQVAERLGIHAEIEAACIANSADPTWLLERPGRALLAEIERRAWSEHCPLVGPRPTDDDRDLVSHTVPLGAADHPAKVLPAQN